VGTIRRECLDFLIPLSESHLRVMLKQWVRHYNEGRPHMSLGPGLPADQHINKDTTVRLNVEENQLVNVFGEFGICLGGLKSA
jgi:hypothetical protein